MSDKTKEAKGNISTLDWFDMSEHGVYVTPELICGKPCILLLDTSLIFIRNEILNKKVLENNGFQPIVFDFDSSLPNYMHILYAETISSLLFAKKLQIPRVKKYHADLIDIKKVFYEHAFKIYNFRVETFLKSAKYIGQNLNKNHVYTSNFGRFKADHSSEQGFQNYEIEDYGVRDIQYFRVKNSIYDALICSKNHIENLIKSRQNLDLKDAINFAALLYQEQGALYLSSQVKPFQILTTLEIFNAIYSNQTSKQFIEKKDNPDFFEDREYYKEICVTREACVSLPRGVYTHYFAAQHITPPPIAYAMQKLLVAGDDVADGDLVLNPMYGYGSLVSILRQKNMRIVGLEISPEKIKLSKLMIQGESKTELFCCDSLNEDLTKYVKANSSFQYVISSPACLYTNDPYEFKDQNYTATDSFTTTRSDIIILMKSLIARNSLGRSVFLLPYYTDRDHDFFQQQDVELSALFSFVHKRYEIENIAMIGNEIYSKSLKNITPILVVIGAKKEYLDKANFDHLEKAKNTLISTYQYLWDWVSFTKYKNSTAIKNDQKIFSLSSLYLRSFQPKVISYESGSLIESKDHVEKVEDTQNSIKANDFFDDEFNSIPPAAPATSTKKTIDYSEFEDFEAGIVKQQEAEIDTKDRPNDEQASPAEEQINLANEQAVSADQDAIQKTPDQVNETHKDAVDLDALDEPDTEEFKAIKSDLQQAVQLDRSHSKIAHTAGALFNTTNHDVIRYHSLTTQTEPNSNVHVRDFNNYLTQKNQLLNSIESLFANQVLADDAFFLSTIAMHRQFNPVEKIRNYIKRNKTTLTIESFIGCYLELDDPKVFSQFLKSEHVDFIAAAFIKIFQKKSLILMDSIGINTDIPLASLIHFNRINKNDVVYIAKDDVHIDNLINSYQQLNQSLFGINGDNFKILVAHKTQNLELEISKSNGNLFLILLGDVKTLKKYSPTIITNLKSPLCIFDTEMDGSDCNSPFLTKALSNSTIYRASKFINEKTNIQYIQNLFSENIKKRFFTKSKKALDEVCFHFIKQGLIENYALFERLDDLSNIKIEIDIIKDQAQNENFNSIFQAYNSAIQNIILLAELIYQLLPAKEKKQNETRFIRSAAKSILELTYSCMNSLSLTHAVYHSTTQNEKPVLFASENIDSVLFSILAKLNIPLDVSAQELNVSDLGELNLKIHTLESDLNQSMILLKDRNEYKNMLDEFNQLIYSRNISVYNYLTNGFTGNESKYPNISTLVAAFFRYVKMDQDRLKNIDSKTAKKISLISEQITNDIYNLVSLPLNYIDFISKSLNQYNVKCSEVGHRSFCIIYDYDEKKWIPSQVSPISRNYNLVDNNDSIIQDFNQGNIDVLISESDAVAKYNIAAMPSQNDGVILDSLRKRVLFLTYFNKEASHFLNIIASANHDGQTSSPEIKIITPNTPSKITLIELILKQLKLYNVYCDFKESEDDLSYYLDKDGLNLLIEFLKINPDFLFLSNIDIEKPSIIAFLDSINLLDLGMQTQVIHNLNLFQVSHNEYLKDSKLNTFDIFSISPKAILLHDKELPNALKFNKKFTQDDKPFNQKIRQVSLSYVKPLNKQLSFQDTYTLLKSNTLKEIESLREILLDYSKYGEKIPQDVETLEHVDLLDIYIKHYTNYLIHVYRHRVFYKLQDRYGNWTFGSTAAKNAMIEKRFSGSYGLKISDDINSLYLEIAILNDLKLLTDYEKSCEVLSFLQMYRNSISSNLSKGEIHPHLIPIASPFNDKTSIIKEGFLIGINFPKPLMLALTQKSFSINVAYPDKSSATQLNLAYVLKDTAVLKKQNVLKKPSDEQINHILEYYNHSKFKTFLSRKLRSMSYTNIGKLTSIGDLQNPSSHPTVYKFMAEKPLVKIRSIDLLTGNLLSIYFMLKNQYTMTLSNYIDENGLTVYGFALPSDCQIDEVVASLNRVTSLTNVSTIFKKHDEQQTLHSLKSIKWHGIYGSLEAINFHKGAVTLILRGTENQLQTVFSDTYIFKEKLNFIDDSKGDANFLPIDITNDQIEFSYQLDQVVEYTIKIPKDHFMAFINTLTSRGLYVNAIIDTVYRNPILNLKV